MARISDIEVLKEKLVIGHIECKELWKLDKQEKLKGNSLKAFETCLKRVCKFDKYKVGRNSYYNITEIYDDIKEREHKNKMALIGNKNKKDKICFEKGSDVEFVSALLMNKIEYFYSKGECGYKSISSWAKVCGLHSDNEFVQNRLRNLVEVSLRKLEKLKFLEIDVQFIACIDNQHIYISEDVFSEYREKSKKCFKNAVGENISSRYRSFYQFEKLYKWKDKSILKEDYWRLMNTNIEYVYRVYKIKPIFSFDYLEDKRYLRLIDVIFGDDNEYLFESVSINESINQFIEDIEDKLIPKNE